MGVSSNDAYDRNVQKKKKSKRRFRIKLQLDKIFNASWSRNLHYAKPNVN